MLSMNILVLLVTSRRGPRLWLMRRCGRQDRCLQPHVTLNFTHPHKCWCQPIHTFTKRYHTGSSSILVRHLNTITSCVGSCSGCRNSIATTMFSNGCTNRSWRRLSWITKLIDPQWHVNLKGEELKVTADISRGINANNNHNKLGCCTKCHNSSRLEVIWKKKLWLETLKLKFKRNKIYFYSVVDVFRGSINKFWSRINSWIWYYDLFVEILKESL